MRGIAEVRLRAGKSQLKTYFSSLAWNLDRHDIFWGECEQHGSIVGLLLYAPYCMLDIDAFQLIGNESYISPCVWVANLIGL